jgi:hypothetical protein
LHSLWFSTIHFLQQGHSCSLQYNCNLSLCSLQNSLISKTNDGSFWYSEIIKFLKIEIKLKTRWETTGAWL